MGRERGLWQFSDLWRAWQKRGRDGVFEGRLIPQCTHTHTHTHIHTQTHTHTHTHTHTQNFETSIIDSLIMIAFIFDPIFIVIGLKSWHNYLSWNNQKCICVASVLCWNCGRNFLKGPDITKRKKSFSKAFFFLVEWKLGC